MIKKVFFTLLGFAVFLFPSCWPFPAENLGIIYELEGITLVLSPAKERYALNDTLYLSYSCVPDFEKFEKYTYKISLFKWIEEKKVWEYVNDDIEVYTDASIKYNWLDEYDTFYASSENSVSPIKRTLVIMPQKEGMYFIDIDCAAGHKTDNVNTYSYSKRYYLHIE